VGLFFTTKSVRGSPDPVGRNVIRIPDPVLDVIDIVRQSLSKGINQVKSGTEQYSKKWFSPSEISYSYLLTNRFANMEMQNRVRCWQ
jgi:hypothetical protein